MPKDLVSDVVLEVSIPEELELAVGAELTFELEVLTLLVAGFDSGINSESAFTLKTKISGTAKNNSFNLLIIFPYIN
tara:strand:- start:151 stop:381 length:231 start_codon:yes stop_codon:yes gene_type:complete